MPRGRGGRRSSYVLEVGEEVGDGLALRVGKDIVVVYFRASWTEEQVLVWPARGWVKDWEEGCSWPTYFRSSRRASVVDPLHARYGDPARALSLLT